MAYSFERRALKNNNQELRKMGPEISPVNATLLHGTVLKAAITFDNIGCNTGPSWRLLGYLYFHLKI